MKTISVIVPCFNEEGNARAVYEQTCKVFESLPNYILELLFIDNASTDKTAGILRDLASHDPRVKVILNARNFGHIRSPFHALMECTGDAAIVMAGDLQDPPPVILEFVRKWEEGFPVVLGVKNQTEETGLYYHLRKLYYWGLLHLSEMELLPGFHGYGLLERRVIEGLRSLHDPYPYFRGMIYEVGFEKAIVHYTQPLRKRGITKNNFYTLYDIAMLGLVNHSKIPLRLAILLGFFMALCSFLTAVGYLVYKLLYWDQFSLGLAPVLVGLFMFSSVQLIFLGVIGEYLGAIFTHVKHRPLVTERERINF